LPPGPPLPPGNPSVLPFGFGRRLGFEDGLAELGLDPDWTAAREVGLIWPGFILLAIAVLALSSSLAVGCFGSRAARYSVHLKKTVHVGDTQKPATCWASLLSQFVHFALTLLLAAASGLLLVLALVGVLSYFSFAGGYLVGGGAQAACEASSDLLQRADHLSKLAGHLAENPAVQDMVARSVEPGHLFDQSNEQLLSDSAFDHDLILLLHETRQRFITDLCEPLGSISQQAAEPLSTCQQAPGLYNSLTGLLFGNADSQSKCLCGTLLTPEPVDPNLACPTVETSPPPPPDFVSDIAGLVPAGSLPVEAAPQVIAGEDSFWAGLELVGAFLDLFDGPCAKTQSMLDESLQLCAAFDGVEGRLTPEEEHANKIAMLNVLRSADELSDEIIEVIKAFYPSIHFQSEQVDLTLMLNLTAEFQPLALVEPACNAAWRLQGASIAWLLGWSLFLLASIGLVINLRKYGLIFTLADLRVKLLRGLDTDGDGVVTHEESVGGKHFLATVGSGSPAARQELM
jgi:hypothetical protein